MSPDEVIDSLRLQGINISRKTLYNWEQWGLIPVAVFRNSRNAEYPASTVGQAHASYTFLSGIDILGQKLKIPVGLTRMIREIYVAAEDARKKRYTDDFSNTDYEAALQRIIDQRMAIGTVEKNSSIADDMVSLLVGVYETIVETTNFWNDPER